MPRGLQRPRRRAATDACGHLESRHRDRPWTLQARLAERYAGDPTAWNDGRILTCQHQRGNAECEIQLLVLSNLHFEAEAARLRSQNGILAGPTCGACGRAYLDAPDEFAFNGANGKSDGKIGKRSVKARALGVRLIHKPCRGKKGARFTVSAEHRRQKDRSDNLQILSQIVNGAGVNDIRRLLFPAKGCSEVGVKRVYDRIFWLERALLAYENAQLAAWRKRLAREGRFRRTRIAHDDIVLGVNWETTADRRITALNCSVSADIRSGYIYRIDVDFDPAVEPVRFVEEIFLGATGKIPALRKQYQQSKGRTFTAPLLTFQRPSGRFNEPALFASARSHLRHFVERAEEALSRNTDPVHPDVQNEISNARVHEDVLRIIADEYFNFPAEERDSRNAFTGIMTRDTHTKAASLACLKGMVPHGKITLVGEQEAVMARVVPHVFRDEILDDRFEWHVISFDKAAKKPTVLRRTARFKNAFGAFMQANPDLAPWQALEQWTAQNLRAEAKADEKGRVHPFPNPNFASKAWPSLWLRSPIHVAGETDKVVGFPILSPRYRGDYKKLGMQSFMQNEADPELRAAIVRRTIAATLQPASTFMNALRERVSFARRSGGQGTRNGPSFVNGACYNPPRLLQLFRAPPVCLAAQPARRNRRGRRGHDDDHGVGDGHQECGAKAEDVGAHPAAASHARGHPPRHGR